MNHNKSTLMCSSYSTVGAVLMTVDEFHQSIVDGTYRNAIADIRTAYAQGNKIAVRQRGKDVEMYAHDYLKGKLPLFVPQGDVTHRRMLEGFCNPTGLVCVDIDHITPEQLVSVSEKLRQLSWVKEYHVSSRGEGLHAIVNMGVIEVPKASSHDKDFVPYVDKAYHEAYKMEYKRRYQEIALYLKNYLGVDTDASCKDVLRGIYPSHDPEAFLRPDHELTQFLYSTHPTVTTDAEQHGPLEVSPENLNATPAIADGSTTSAVAVEIRLLFMFLSYNIYKPSTRHNWWGRLAQYLHSKGVSRTALPSYRQQMQTILQSRGLIRTDDPLLRSTTEVDEVMEWGYIHSEKIETTKPEEPEEWLAYVNDEEELARLMAIAKPKAMVASLQSQPERVVMATVCGLMPVMMAYATHVTATYCDGKPTRLNGMTCVVAPQGGLKSGVKDMVALWKQPMELADQATHQAEERHKELRNSQKSSESLPPPPKLPMRYIVPTISCSALLKRLKLAEGRHLFSFCEEIDTISKTNSAGSWSQKYDLYRLSFENGEWGQDYNSDQAESGMVKVAYNWTFMGTPQAVRRCFVGNGSVENGLAGRVHFAVIPPEPFAHMPKYKPMTYEQALAINQGVEILRQAKGHVDTPRLCHAIEKWCDGKADEAAKTRDTVVDTFRKRAAIIGFRAGVVFHILEQGEKWIAKNQVLDNAFLVSAVESKPCVDFALLMADHALKYQCMLWGSQLLDDQHVVVTTTMRYQSRSYNLLDELPDKFSFQQLTTLRSNMSAPALRTMISRWKKKGMIEPMDRNMWKKTYRTE